MCAKVDTCRMAWTRKRQDGNGSKGKRVGAYHHPVLCFSPGRRGLNVRMDDMSRTSQLFNGVCVCWNMLGLSQSMSLDTFVSTLTSLT